MSKSNWIKLPDCVHTNSGIEWVIPGFDDSPIRAEKPINWVSHDGRKFPFTQGGFPAQTKHIPPDAFPLTIEYEPLKPRAWENL